MVLKQCCDLNKNKKPLELMKLPKPVPKENEILVKVSVCGVCHTELDEIEGRTPPLKFPIVLGHQVVGNIEQMCNITQMSNIAERFKVLRIGKRVDGFALLEILLAAVIVVVLYYFVSRI
ncbi:MAG: alcohol dehydrogenase catalytic domain-containing protein [Elusimicrobiota bacterium]